MNLQTKFFPPLFLLITALVVYIHFFWAPRLYDYMRRDDFNHLQAHLKSVSEGLVPLLLENQLASIYDSLDSMLETNKNWKVILLYGTEGEMLYPLNAVENFTLGKHEVMIEQPIKFLQHNLGRLKVIVDQSNDFFMVRSIQNDMLSVFIISMVLFIVAIIVLIRFIIHKPLGQLVRASDSLAAGEFSIDLPKNRSDEVGHLIRSFSSMRDAIEAYQTQLKKEISDHKITANELYQEKERATYHAAHDALTGLVNRREFEERLHQALLSAHNKDYHHALLYMDLDQFKVVNDTCGHVAGDALLRQLSALLLHKIREGDTLARLGGDEFGVLLEHCSIESAGNIANQLREEMQDFHFEWEGNVFRVGSSIGLVPITMDSTSIEALLSSADSACYAAKDKGRNRVHIFLPDDKALAQRHGEMQWVTKISKAIDEQRLVLYQQPVVITKHPHDKLEYSEILVRLQDENGDIIPPGAFLPAAERYNLVSHVDHYVVNTLFKYLKQHPEQQNKIHAINLSQVSIGEDSFLDFIVDQLKYYKINGTQICFEITETAAVMDLNFAIHFINTLKQYGCRFALDDFGRGLSSLVYLKNLPVDYLKIDGTFVKDILRDPVDLAMVKSINEIGHIMGMKTIAEFVESEEIYKLLRNINVDCVQGFWLGMPEPLEQ